MMMLGLALAGVMGITLGVLGGGGSILTVPILTYAFGLEPKVAIATSLVVVGATSLVATLEHARKGRVDWSTAALMGPTAMIAAYGGGRLAAYLPGDVLLVLFALTMLAAAVAMLRGERSQGASRARRRPPRWVATAGAGLGVGALTGLIGAGGGFLIVPALVTLAGVEMHVAIGTSLLLIAANSFAGLAGYASHVAIDAHLAALVVLAAAAGSLGGAALAARLPAFLLRKAFAVFVLVAAAVMLLQHVPVEIALPIAGGVCIGVSASLVWLFSGDIAGVSGIVAGLLRPRELRFPRRVAFVIGLVAGGLVLRAQLPHAFDVTTHHSLALFAVAGALVGFGTRLGNGCTSGHGVCGISRGAPRSMAATATFMLTAMAVVYVANHVFGGIR